MQKKSLALLMALSCFIVHAHDPEYSVFSSMPEDARNKIPLQQREAVDAEWRKEQDDNLNKEIDEYFDGILLKEFEKSGSIEEAVKAKEESNAKALAERKSQVCRCSRHRWPWQYYSVKTEVEKNDEVLKDEIKKINLRYKEAAAKHTEKSATIRQEVVLACSQYKRKIKHLKRVYKSVQQCHNDLHCHEDNDIFDRHLSLERREAIINKVFINAVESCKRRNIADKDILAQIWEKDPKLVKYQAEAKNLNNLIDKGLNPDLDEQEERQD